MGPPHRKCPHWKEISPGAKIGSRVEEQAGCVLDTPGPKRPNVPVHSSIATNPLDRNIILFLRWKRAKPTDGTAGGGGVQVGAAYLLVGEVRR